MRVGEPFSTPDIDPLNRAAACYQMKKINMEVALKTNPALKGHHDIFCEFFGYISTTDTWQFYNERDYC
jgi:hypothetical protein